MTPLPDFDRWPDTQLRRWIQARLQNHLLPEERPAGREEFPLWTELATLVDQACRPYSSGLDPQQAARIRQLASEEIAEFLQHPKISTGDLSRGLLVLLRGGEMAERPYELQLRVGPVLLALIERLESNWDKRKVNLLREALTAAWAISLPLPQKLLDPLVFRDELLPWLLPFFQSSQDRGRHPRAVARALARCQPGSAEEEDLLLWTGESLPETAAERNRWRSVFENAAEGQGIDRLRTRRWLLDIGVIDPEEEEIPVYAHRMNNLFQYHAAGY
jgi:hypothetical protein